MQDPSASVETAPPSSIPLPDAGLVTAAAWPDLTAGGRSAVRPDKAKSVSRAMLALGGRDPAPVGSDIERKASWTDRNGAFRQHALGLSFVFARMIGWGP